MPQMPGNQSPVVVDTGYRPHRYQLEIHQRLKRFSVLVCHRRFGKTYLAINTLVDAGARTRKDAARFGYVAPYRNQAKTIAWDYLKRFALKIPGTEVAEADLFVTLPNSAQLRLFGADNADAMRGLYLDGVVLDEVADMKPYVWGEVIRPALADRKGWALFIGTPKGINLFHELYETALADPTWYAALYRADETDILDPAELEAAKATMSDAQYRQEFLCDFQAASDNVLITIDLVSRAAHRTIVERDIQGAPKVIGVDVARFGDDRSCIFKRQGLCAHPPKILSGTDNMALAGMVATEIAQWHPDAVFVDAGRGEGVIDRLRQLGHAVIEVPFGGKPSSTAYKNKRAEMWDALRAWLEAGGSIPNITELKSEMASVTYAFDAAGRMVLEPKDELKERGLPSPDLADALALTFAHPVMPVTGKGGLASAYDVLGGLQSSYDTIEG